MEQRHKHIKVDCDALSSFCRDLIVKDTASVGWCSSVIHRGDVCPLGSVQSNLWVCLRGNWHLAKLQLIPVSGFLIKELNLFLTDLHVHISSVHFPPHCFEWSRIRTSIMWTAGTRRAAYLAMILTVIHQVLGDQEGFWEPMVSSLTCCQ